MRISAKHNQALLEVVENILLQISDEPIINLRKLLEVYGELLQVNRRIYNEALDAKLSSWKSINTLRKAVENIAG